jgi:phosphatidate cytidylyltransferase
VVSFLALLMIMWAAHLLDIHLVLHSVLLHFLATACVAIIFFQRDRLIFETAKKQIIGVLYVPLLLSYLILIRGGEDTQGTVWIFFVLCVVFAGDIGALYVGTFFGKHPLHPAVSPKKTIEGSLGGIAANLIFGSTFKLIFLNDLSWPISLLFFITIGITGQVGDLFESGLKRMAKVKDSGGILPGHGGILDRADAIMFAAPVAYLFKMYLF